VATRTNSEGAGALPRWVFSRGEMSAGGDVVLGAGAGLVRAVLGSHRMGGGLGSRKGAASAHAHAHALDLEEVLHAGTGMGFGASSARNFRGTGTEDGMGLVRVALGAARAEQRAASGFVSSSDLRLESTGAQLITRPGGAAS